VAALPRANDRLSAALTRAVREELISRNVARLPELPSWQPAEVRSWSADEALAFLRAAQPDPLFPAFVFLLVYGMRRGEVLGLRSTDVDHDASMIRVRQQLQRADGSLRTGPVKTRAGNRDLPLVPLARQALVARQQKQQADRAVFGRARQDSGLVFTTRSGLPVEPPEPGPLLPADLRPPQDPRDHGAPYAAHNGLVAEEASCPAQECSDDLGPCAVHHDDAGLHACRRGSAC
jgi:integrase